MPIGRCVCVVFHAEVRFNLNAFGDRLFARALALRDARCANNAFLANLGFGIRLWHEVFAVNVFVNVDGAFGCLFAGAGFGCLGVLGHSFPLVNMLK